MVSVKIMEIDELQILLRIINSTYTPVIILYIQLYYWLSQKYSVRH